MKDNPGQAKKKKKALPTDQTSLAAEPSSVGEKAVKKVSKKAAKSPPVEPVAVVAAASEPPRAAAAGGRGPLDSAQVARAVGID